MIMLCPCRFINCNKCTTLVGDVGSGEGYACVGAGGMWEISVPSPVFFSEPRTGLKNNPNLKIGILGIVSRVTCCQLLPE